jgi:hypothetical protein
MVGGKKMRKLILVSMVFLMLAIPITTATELNSSDKPVISKEAQTFNQEFTHKVLAEYGTMTTCPPCVTANAQLKSIYQSGDLDFIFVTMVWNKANSRVKARLQELKINNVPDVYFDGKFTHILGGQTTEQPYRNAITQAGERDVPDIDIDVDVDWVGGSVIKFTVTVNNNEPDPFNGLLRAYVVEKVSRWNDLNDKPYHFAALDIPIDKNVKVVSKNVKPIGGTFTFKRTWIGLLHGFGDIEKDNIMVIATLFDADTDYAVETAMGEPTTQTGNQAFSYIIYRILDNFPILKQFFNTFLIK